MLVRDRLYEVALERDLRRTTVTSYLRLLGGVGLLDMTLSEAAEGLSERLWAIENPNTRRSTVIACRSVLGVRLRIPTAIPRRYDLPSEDTLRLALMNSAYEARGLLMLYCGLRIGEACAITKSDLQGDRLRVDKQILQTFHTGQPTRVTISPVKAHEATVTVPRWLSPIIETLTTTDVPGPVRESLRRAGKKVGIDLNPHQLRHACATMLLERGVPIVAVSKHLRHSDIATTLRVYAQHDTGKYVHDVFG